MLKCVFQLKIYIRLREIGIYESGVFKFPTILRFLLFKYTNVSIIKILKKCTKLSVIFYHKAFQSLEKLTTHLIYSYWMIYTYNINTNILNIILMFLLNNTSTILFSRLICIKYIKCIVMVYYY